MKNIITIIGVSAMALTFTSCQDWLDMKSEAKADQGSVFETVARAEMAVVGCYPFTFNRELYYQLGMGTDECLSAEGETNSKNQVGNYQYTPSNIPSDTYKAMYKGIEYANICVKNIPGMSPSSESESRKLNSLLGEALAVRAANYLNVVRYFGDVPYSKVPVADLSTFSSSRVSRDIIYDNCIDDLQRAVELLPWASEKMVSSPERYTKNAALGMLARTALYAAGYSLRWDLDTYSAASVKLAKREDDVRVKELYQIAADACKMIIEKNENKLLNKYDQVFRDLVNGNYNDETILEFGQCGNNVNSASIGYTTGVFAHTNSQFLKAAPQVVAVPTLFYEYDEADIRRDVTICNYGITAENTHRMAAHSAGTAGKFRVDWKKQVGTSSSKRDINWPVLRYSDVLLMYAEAINELKAGPDAEAIAALTQVRTRAFGGDADAIGQIPSGYEDFRNAVIQERKLELAFESWRRTDLIRFGMLYETLTEEKAKIVRLAERTGEYVGVEKYRAFKSTRAVFENPTVALKYMVFDGADLTESEATSMTKNGYVTRNFFEDSEGNVYIDESLVPSGVNAEPVAYTILDMDGSYSLMHAKKLGANEAWCTTSLFRGLEKNKVELLPLNTTSMIDINPGLVGQQHPLY